MLLYNFFCSEACAGADWRWLGREDIPVARDKAVLGGYYLEEIGKGCFAPDAVAQRPRAHQLRQLYVALTRASASMWIFYHYPCESAYAFLMQTGSVTPVQYGAAVEPLFDFDS